MREIGLLWWLPALGPIRSGRGSLRLAGLESASVGHWDTVCPLQHHMTKVSVRLVIVFQDHTKPYDRQRQDS